MSDHNKDEIMAHFGRSTPLLVERRRTKRRISIRLVLQLTVVVQGDANPLRKPNRYLSLPSCGLLLLLPVHGACLPRRWVGRRCFSLPRTLLPPPLMPRPENELVADTAECCAPCPTAGSCRQKIEESNAELAAVVQRTANPLGKLARDLSLPGRSLLLLFPIRGHRAHTTALHGDSPCQL